MGKPYHRERIGRVDIVFEYRGHLYGGPVPWAYPRTTAFIFHMFLYIILPGTKKKQMFSRASLVLSRRFAAASIQK